MSRSETPVHDIRLGAIRASIWVNESRDQRRFFNVTLSRLYRDGEEWKQSQSFGRDDLPVVGKVVDLAYSWIWNQFQTGRSADVASSQRDGVGA